MEDQCSPLSWAYFYQKESLVHSTLELESALVSAYDEISRKDEEIHQLKALLAQILKQRDEFHSKCHDLTRILAGRRLDSCPISSSDEDESDCGNSISNVLPQVPAVERPLPEKGRLLQAVMEAGPLLQNLLLAGPLPRWQHPPPRLRPVEIPPVRMSSSPRVLNRDFSPSPKYQKRVCSPN